MIQPQITTVNLNALLPGTSILIDLSPIVF
jgi:hypothetical protein